MYKGRTLTELAKELRRQADEKRDFRAPTSLLEMSFRNLQPIKPGADLLADPPQRGLFLRELGNSFDCGLTELTHDQVGKWCEIPAKYYDRMRYIKPSLLCANVNTWLRQNKETRLIRTLDNKVRAFLSNKYRIVDNWDIAETALPILTEESKKLGTIEVLSSDVTETRLYIKVVSKRLTYEVKKGDVVQAGVSISNSEVGKGSVRVEPFLYRLACTNGAIIEDSAVRKFHLGRSSEELEAAEQVFRDETRAADDKAFMMKLQDIIRASFDDVNFARLKDITIDATTRKITAPIQDVVEEVANRYRLSDKYKDSFLKNLIDGGDTSQWGLANAITAIANTANSYEDATELEKIGGSLIAMPKVEWAALMEEAA